MNNNREAKDFNSSIDDQQVPSVHESLKNLIAEQKEVQEKKFQGRTLSEYSGYIFPGQKWKKPRGSAAVDLLQELSGPDCIDLKSFLLTLSEKKHGAVLSWVDMGGGRALPMRQLMAEGLDAVRMINIDLFDYGLGGLEEDELTCLEKESPGVTKQQGPLFVHADIQAVSLSEKPDLITSVEVIQYLNNPLAAICNWYNQLNDNGILVVATEHDMASWIRYEGKGETATKDILDRLTSAGIRFAATGETDWESGHRPFDPNYFRELVIQKEPSTKLVLNSQVTEVWLNPHKYKAVYYENPNITNNPILQIVKD